MRWLAPDGPRWSTSSTSCTAISPGWNGASARTRPSSESACGGAAAELEPLVGAELDRLLAAEDD
jgi:hypothetical protein